MKNETAITQQIGESNVIALSVSRELVPHTVIEELEEKLEPGQSEEYRQRALLAARELVRGFADAKDVFDIAQSYKDQLGGIVFGLAAPLTKLWSKEENGVKLRLKTFGSMVEDTTREIIRLLNIPDSAGKNNAERLASTQLGQFFLDQVKYVRAGLREGVDFYAKARGSDEPLYHTPYDVYKVAEGIRKDRINAKDTAKIKALKAYEVAKESGNADALAKAVDLLARAGVKIPNSAGSSQQAAGKREQPMKISDTLPDPVATALRRVMSATHQVHYEPKQHQTGNSKAIMVAQVLTVAAMTIGNIENGDIAADQLTAAALVLKGAIDPQKVHMLALNGNGKANAEPEASEADDETTEATLPDAEMPEQDASSTEGDDATSAAVNQD